MTFNPCDVSDETVLDAVEDLYEAGVTDGLEGGVPAEAVVEHDDIPYTLATVKGRLSALADNRNDLVQVIGVSPETGTIRHSYLPADEVDDWPTG